MREDQFTKLQALQEKLCDTAMVEADPANWPGGEKLPMDMTKDERGDRYWCKRNAAATLTLLNKTITIQSYRKSNLNSHYDDFQDDDIDKEIEMAEREVKKQLEAFEKKKRLKVVT